MVTGKKHLVQRRYAHNHLQDHSTITLDTGWQTLDSKERCMNVSDTEKKSASGAVVSGTTTTRLTGSWLIVVRAAWVALVVPSLGLFVANLFAYYQQLQRVCASPPLMCNLPGALTAKELQALPTIGFSIKGYATLLTISLAIMVSLWCAVGFLLFWRKSDDWLALLAAFFLVMFSITPAGDNPGFVLVSTYPVLTLPISLVSFLGQVSIYMFFLFFPNGRLVSRWMGLILLLVIIDAFLNNFPSPTSTFNANWPSWLRLLDTPVLAGATLVSQIYHYRHISTPHQRQQTKWIVLGVTVAVAVIIGLQIISFLPLSSIQQNPLGGAISDNIFYFAVLLIPLSIGFSILRYRLYDIDIIINRTLVYASLTVLLLGLYVGLIFALQSLFQGVFKQNDVAVVVSTLVIAALFQPLRHRLQRIIDRRFYRRKYDAARMLAQFSATLRNEVDLQQLQESLVAVVEETMQPSHVSLWLRPAQQNGKHATAWTSHHTNS
jgi:hypothetical protein